MEGCAWDPSSLDTDVGGWRVLGQPGLQHQVLSLDMRAMLTPNLPGTPCLSEATVTRSHIHPSTLGQILRRAGGSESFRRGTMTILCLSFPSSPFLVG